MEAMHDQVDQLLHDAEHADSGAGFARMMSHAQRSIPRHAERARELAAKRDQLIRDAVALDPERTAPAWRETILDAEVIDAAAPAAEGALEHGILNDPRLYAAYTLGKREAGHRMRALEDELAGLRAEMARLTTPRPLAEWHDDDGTVHWWHIERGEPPYSGTPGDSDWPGDDQYTHWTPIPEPRFTEASEHAP